MTPDFNRICRLCLIEEYSLVPIFDEVKQGRPTVPLPQQMMSIASLKVRYKAISLKEFASWLNGGVYFNSLLAGLFAPNPNAHTPRLFTSADL